MVVHMHAVIPALRSWRIYKFVASLDYMRREGERERERKEEKEKKKGGKESILFSLCTA